MPTMKLSCTRRTRDPDPWTQPLDPGLVPEAGSFGWVPWSFNTLLATHVQFISNHFMNLPRPDSCFYVLQTQASILSISLRLPHSRSLARSLSRSLSRSLFSVCPVTIVLIVCNEHLYTMHMHTHIHTHTPTHTHSHRHSHTQICTHIHTYTHIITHKQTDIHTQTHTHTNVQIHRYICISTETQIQSGRKCHLDHPLSIYWTVAVWDAVVATFWHGRLLTGLL